VLAVLFFAAYLFARVKLEQAREDWANAFFYSPSQKTKQRQRRQRWQDRTWAMLILCLVSLAAAGLLYLSVSRPAG
jgi:hypothetical protein